MLTYANFCFAVNNGRTIDFCKGIVESWWSEQSAFVFVNLSVLHSIFTGQSESIRNQIRIRMGSQIGDILQKMRRLQESRHAEGAVVMVT